MHGIADLLIGPGPVLIVLVIAGGLFFMNAVRVVQEYERGVIFRLGRLVGARSPPSPSGPPAGPPIPRPGHFPALQILGGPCQG
jgi:regulator of protease activity HflC (stomatin/prohibitin superfamily)